MSKYCFIFILNAISISLYSQLLINKGEVYVKSNVLFFVDGSFQNNGTLQIENVNGFGELIIKNDIINNHNISNDGKIKLHGNWINNNFFISSLGTVELNGGNQDLKGTETTHFNNLVLQGSGKKTMHINQFVHGKLDITHIELQTKEFRMFVENDDVQAITRTSGFVSSDENGFLSRKMSTNQTYLFPVGSSVPSLRYRPVEISPYDSNVNYFTVRMASTDATFEGYDRNSKNSNIVNTNEKYYHQIDRSDGNTSVDLAIYFDITSDGAWDGISYWTSGQQWEMIESANVISGTPLSKAYAQNWNIFSEKAYILHTYDIDLVFPNVITPNSDGINDTFVIVNGNEIPNNLIVFNRWGKKVFEQSNYQNDWDGGNLTEGTYYYIFYYLGKTFESSLSIIR
jgi:gliding motility-associated-like protein